MAACGQSYRRLWAASAISGRSDSGLWAVPLPPMGGSTAACERSHCSLWVVPLLPLGGPTAPYGRSQCCLWAVPLQPVRSHCRLSMSNLILFVTEVFNIGETWILYKHWRILDCTV